MAGTKRGGRKTAAKNKKTYGKNFYAQIGAIGGRNGHTGGFHANRELARYAGTKGGCISSKGYLSPAERARRKRNFEKVYGELQAVYEKAKAKRELAKEPGLMA